MVFVADATLKRVFGYGPDGELTIAIGHEGELEAPSGLAVDRGADRVYVADAGKHQVFAYSTRDGALVSTIGKRGGEPGEFNYPTNLSVDARGPPLRGRHAELPHPDVRSRRQGAADVFGELGDSPGRFNRPKGVAVDSEGHIYVADSSFNNFQIFDQEGRLLLFVGKGGSLAGEFSLPAGLYIDDQDRIYVADQGNSRVQVFQYVKANAGNEPGGRESMKRVCLLVGAMVLVLSSTSYAQFTATIAGGPHDLSNGSAVRNSNTTINGQTCVFCHVPHSGSTNLPLWNRSNPTGAAYQVYTSSTSTSVATAAGLASGISGACMSCHDGTIAMDVVTNVNGLPFGTAPTGGSVGFTAGPEQEGHLLQRHRRHGQRDERRPAVPRVGPPQRPSRWPSSTRRRSPPTRALHARSRRSAPASTSTAPAAQLPLYGSSTANATVECASCHDAHNNSLNGTNGGFLRQANTGSQMCKACHNK